MNLKKNEKLYLEQLLADMGKPLRNKGYKLYAEGGCTFVGYDDITHDYEFYVSGNIEPHYQVIISLGETKPGMWFIEDTFSCDCLYFEENLECKHVAAALFYLAVSKPNLSLGSDHVAKKNDKPIVLQCHPQDPHDILEKINFKKDSLNFYPHLKNAEIGKEHIRYLLTNSYYEYELTVRTREDGLIFETNNKSKPMLSSLLHWFHHRIERHPKDLAYLTPEGRNDALQQVLKDHNIPVEKVRTNEVLKIVFAKDDFYIVPYGELDGLYQPEAVIGKLHTDLIAKNRSWTEGHYLEEENDPEYGKYNAGFVVHWNRYSRQLEGIYPILAKGSKHEPHELKVKFDWLSSPKDPRLSQKGDLTEVFLHLKNIHDLLGKLKVETQRLALHQYLDDFFEATMDYPFYLMERYFYEKEKPRKMDLNPLKRCRGRLYFHMSKETLSYSLQPVIEVGEQSYFLKDIKEKADLLDDFVILEEKQLVLLDSPKDITALKSFWEHPIIRYTEASKPEIEEKLLKELAVDYPFHFGNNMMTKEEVSTKPLRQVIFPKCRSL